MITSNEHNGVPNHNMEEATLFLIQSVQGRPHVITDLELHYITISNICSI